MIVGRESVPDAGYVLRTWIDKRVRQVFAPFPAARRGCRRVGGFNTNYAIPPRNAHVLFFSFVVLLITINNLQWPSFYFRIASCFTSLFFRAVVNSLGSPGCYPPL